MTHPEIEPAAAAASDVGVTEVEAEVVPSIAPAFARNPAPPVAVAATSRFSPGPEALADVLQGAPHPRWIDSSRAKIIEGHAVALQAPFTQQPRRPAADSVDHATVVEPETRSEPKPAETVRPRAETSKPGPSRHVRKVAAVAVAVGLCGAAGAFGRFGHADVAETVAKAPPAVVAKAAEPKESEAAKQIAQLAVDMRLMSAKVETLRAEIERTRYSDDTRALKRSVDAMRSGLEASKSETAVALGQMAQKLERLQREPSARLAQIADRLERIERRTVVSNEVTGSISHSPSTPTAEPTPVPVSKPTALTHTTSKSSDPPAPPVRTASTTLPGPKTISPSETEAKPEPKPQPRVLQGLILRDVQDGVAIVEGRGGLFGVSRGDVIPGVGRIEGFERRGRETVVVTSRGLITSHYTQR